MRGEIYDYDERLERYRRLIAKLPNGQLALRFLDHLGSLGLSLAALSNYASHLAAVLRLMDFDPRNATRSDVERVVATINANRLWKESTKHHKRVLLRKFIQYAKYGSCDRATSLPPEVSWLKLTRNDKDSRVTPETLLTKEDFDVLVKAADNPRDRAMAYTLFEGALRPGELLSMNVGSVEFKQGYCLITVNGKTGLKRLPLIASYKPLLEWLKEHPRKDDLNAPLWCSLARNYEGERLSYRHFRLIIKRLARKAGLRKAVWPYLFRHSTLTALAKVLTEARLEQYAGWVHGSGMAARYVHFSVRDLEDAMLELHGLKPAQPSETLLRYVTCKRCGEPNPPGNVRCDKCGLILDKEVALKAEGERAKEIEDLKKQINELKALVNTLLSSSQKSSQQPSQAPQSSAESPQELSSEPRQPRTLQPPENTDASALKKEQGGG
ncbi:MAG: site-specific integrase [Candidatus Jordarchaeales archaeon]